MARRLNLRLSVQFKWMFWPAVLAVYILQHVGLARNMDRAMMWITNHMVRVIVAKETN